MDVDAWSITGDGNSMERCFCTQTIKILRYALYKPTNQYCLVGSECIAKFLGEHKKDKANGKVCNNCDTHLDKRKKFHREHYSCSIECLEEFVNKKYRKCNKCKELSILKIYPDSIDICHDCEYKIKNFCECNICKELTILKKDIETIMYCDKCVDTIKKYRKCDKCNKYHIDKTEPEWKKICKTCYVQYKNKMRQCQNCVKYNIPIYEPEWKKICKICYVESKK
jgi:hypothetical protein